MPSQKMRRSIQELATFTIPVSPKTLAQVVKSPQKILVEDSLEFLEVAVAAQVVVQVDPADLVEDSLESFNLKNSRTSAYWSNLLQIFLFSKFLVKKQKVW